MARLYNRSGVNDKTVAIEPPARPITVNLAPADLPKEGSHYDLPIALGLMAAIGAIPPDALSGFTVLGELGLDGSIAPVARQAYVPVMFLRHRPLSVSLQAGEG